MRRNERSLGLTTLRVFDFLSEHRGTVFALEDICRQTGCTPTQVRLALETLVRHDVIHQEHTVGGGDAYGYRLPDPSR